MCEAAAGNMLAAAWVCDWHLAEISLAAVAVAGEETSRFKPLIIEAFVRSTLASLRSFLSAFRFARSFLACAGLGNGSLSAATSSGVSGGKTLVVIQGAAVSPGEADEHDVGVPVF